MSDGGRWNQPAAPDEGRDAAPTPVTGVDPRPLPLPPGANVPRPQMRRRVAIAVAAGAVGILVLCGVSWLALRAVFSVVGSSESESVTSYDDESGSSAFDGVSGVSVAKWAEDGRYAVVEYLPSGTDATTTIVAWDARTGSVATIEGFRIVAVEPASSQVWVTKAAAPHEGTGDFEFTSPWEVSSWDAPESDGPGTAWRWDVAHPEVAPERVAAPTWRPWTGPSGSIVSLSVQPKTGLWPRTLTFGAPGSTKIARLPAGVTTFLPIGWSPSGRYFAIIDSSQSASPETKVVIYDSVDGALKASYSTSGTFGNGMHDKIDGAAWDVASDDLWVATSSSGDDGDTTSVSIVALGADGTTTPLRGIPASWATAFDGPTVLGADEQGVLVSVETEDDASIWRIADGGLAKAGSLYDSDYDPTGAGSYWPQQGLIVSGYESSDAADGSDSGDWQVDVVDINGSHPRRIWPKP